MYHRQKKMHARQNEMMVCSFLKKWMRWKPMSMTPSGMAGSCAAALLALCAMAVKTRTTKVNSMTVRTRMRKPMNAGRGAGGVRATVPGTLPVGPSSPLPMPSPVFLVRVVGVDELQVDEAGDHDEQHAGQADEADPVLLQRMPLAQLRTLVKEQGMTTLRMDGW